MIFSPLLCSLQPKILNSVMINLFHCHPRNDISSNAGLIFTSYFLCINGKKQYPVFFVIYHFPQTVTGKQDIFCFFTTYVVFRIQTGIRASWQIGCCTDSFTTYLTPMLSTFQLQANLINMLLFLYFHRQNLKDCDSQTKI